MIAVNRRRYMGNVVEAIAYDENSYIQDGLIFQLDGINKGSINDAWTDLKGGISLTGSDSNNYEFGLDYVKVFADSDCLESSSYVAANTNLTLEVCFTPASTYAPSFYSGPRVNGAPNLRINFNKKYIVYANYKTLVNGTVALNKPHTVSMNSAVASIDGVQKTLTTGTQNFTSSYKTAIRGTNNIFYAIRIYNRQLSYDEMLINEHIDNKRFKLNLNV